MALIVLNPMVAFMSSGVNPDAVSFPLSTLAILFVWRVLSRGTDRGRALVCLLAAALVKPSAGPLFVGLASGVVVVWLTHRWPLTRRLLDASDRNTSDRETSDRDASDRDTSDPERTDHSRPALLVVLQAAILSAWVFYLWSPLLFADQQGSHDSLKTYVRLRIRGMGSIAIEFWGRLGWLDYQIADGWYALLYALVMVNVACVCWRPRRPLAFAACSGSVFVAFASMTMAGEFGYLTQAGYTLQGRYFLPAILGLLVPVLSHRVPPARYARLAGLIVVNLLLAQRTVTRYYQDQWSGVRQALP